MSVHKGGRGPGHISRTKRAASGGGAGASPALKFNVASNSQYLPVMGF